MMREFPFDTGTVTLNIAEGPRNGPLLLMLHGFSNRWQTLWPLIEPLSAHYHILTYDQRGHGKSGRVPGGYTAAGFYEDLLAVVRRFVDSPAIFIGHSMGGAIALHLAVDHPQRVRAVAAGDASLDTSVHIAVMNNRRNTKLFGLRRKLAGRALDDLLRRGLPPDSAEELSLLDPSVMDYHADGRVEGFFVDIPNVNVTRIRCPHLIVQANPAKGGLLQDEEVSRALAARPDLNILRLDAAHDLDLACGVDSPFFIHLNSWLQSLNLRS
ncbi:MAG: alpha/beta fold hydrolase [Anaerolineales bacterium]